MGISDGLTIGLFSTIAVSLTLFAVLAWRKIYRPTFTNFLIRLLIIVLCQALVVITVGLEVNRQNGFYESWNDLFGTTSSYSQSSTTAGAMATITQSQLTHADKTLLNSLLVREVISGKQSHVSNVVYLDLPAAAVADINKRIPLDPKRYRVVEFLTGFPSQPLMWVKTLGIDKVLATYNQNHMGHEVIGIIPQVNIAGHYDLECMNLPGTRPRAETWLSSDIHSYLSTRLGMRDSKWGIMGVSTGAWCAAMLSIRHPELYSAAASIAGYYRPALPAANPIALQNEMSAKYDLSKAEASLTMTQNLYITASLGDRYSMSETKRFLSIKHPHVAVTYRELKSGGHHSQVWVKLIPDALVWLERNISV
jgi:pimeloyl-ACP methyl ester carboxylesterase